MTQSVTIQAEVSAIKTDDASVSEILSTRAVSELPLNGRDPMMLAVTTPGVLLGTKSSMTGVPPGNDFVGAGTREIQNSMSLDGISIMNNLITTTPTRPMVETVQEVEVQTGTYSAQYGAYMGVHINMVTKGGTNQFHGNMLEFLRNDALDARNYLHVADTRESHRAEAAAPAKPVRRRVRWAGDSPQDLQRQRQDFLHGLIRGTSSTSNNPRRCPRKCPLSSLTAIFRRCRHPASPAESIKDPLTGHAFPGNIIPANRISPVARKLQQYYPAPNLPGLANNFSVPVPSDAAL